MNELLGQLTPDEVNNFWIPLYDWCKQCGACIVIRHEGGRYVALNPGLDLMGQRSQHVCKPTKGKKCNPRKTTAKKKRGHNSAPPKTDIGPS